MELINRYLYAVTKHLPENTRADVEKELRGNIEDMLPEGYTESNAKEVLAKLGDPRKLADEYRETKRYLIGPELYDTYLSVLKLVISIAAGVLLVVGMLAGIVDNQGNNYIDVVMGIFWSAVGASIEGALQAVVWVTVVFAILERTGVSEGKIPRVKKKWTPDDLAPIPSKVRRQIPKSEAVAHMVFATFFTAVLCAAPGLFGWYEERGGVIVRIAGLFNEQTMRSYIPAILLLFVIGIAVATLKLITGKWTVLLASLNTAYNVLFCAFFSIALVRGALFNEVFFNKIQEAVGKAQLDTIVRWNQNSWIAVAGVVIVISAVDSVMGYVKCLRNK